MGVPRVREFTVLIVIAVDGVILQPGPLNCKRRDSEVGVTSSHGRPIHSSPYGALLRPPLPLRHPPQAQQIAHHQQKIVDKHLRTEEMRGHSRTGQAKRLNEQWRKVDLIPLPGTDRSTPTGRLDSLLPLDTVEALFGAMWRPPRAWRY